MSAAEEARQDLAVFERALLHARTGYEKLHAQSLVTSAKNRIAEADEKPMNEDERQRHASRELDRAAQLAMGRPS